MNQLPDICVYKNCPVRAEAATKEFPAREFYTRVLETLDGGAFDGFWIWEVGSEKEYYSPAFCATFGYTQEDLGDTSEGWRRIIFPEDLDRVMTNLGDCLKREKPYNFYVRYRHKNGGTVHIVCRAGIFDDEGGQYMVGTHTDVTPLMRDITGLDFTLRKALRDDGREHS